MLVIRAGIHMLPVKITNRELPDQTASSAYENLELKALASIDGSVRTVHLHSLDRAINT